MLQKCETMVVFVNDMIDCGLCTASDSCKPRVLWSLYFNVNNTSHRDLTSAVDNILVVGGPDELMDYDNAIAEVTVSELNN